MRPLLLLATLGPEQRCLCLPTPLYKGRRFTRIALTMWNLLHPKRLRLKMERCLFGFTLIAFPPGLKLLSTVWRRADPLVLPVLTMLQTPLRANPRPILPQSICPLNRTVRPAIATTFHPQTLPHSTPLPPGRKGMKNHPHTNAPPVKAINPQPKIGSSPATP